MNEFLQILMAPPPRGMCPGCYRELLLRAAQGAIDAAFQHPMFGGQLPDHKCPPAAVAAAEQLLKGGSK